MSYLRSRYSTSKEGTLALQAADCRYRNLSDVQTGATHFLAFEGARSLNGGAVIYQACCRLITVEAARIEIRSGYYQRDNSGCGAAWLARLTGGQEAGGSNPLSPTKK